MKFRISKSKLKIIIITALCIFLLSKCMQRYNIKTAQETIPVRVMTVQLQDFNETVDYVGNIKGQDEAIVYPKVSGKVIEKVKEEGAVINKGDVIAYIDRDEVGLEYEKAPVESPLAGVVGKIYVDIGTNVNIQTPIALVVDMDRVRIDLDIPEKYVPKVSLGQEANISGDAYPEEEFTGTVSKVAPVLDPATRTAALEITVDNPGHRLRSGMFARVKLIIQKHTAVPVILKEAILGREPNFYVYAVENNKAVMRTVKLGIRQDSHYEVKEGVKEGDLVVIMGQQRLYDGAAVSVEE